jgi:hypothetical protein
MGMSGLLVCPKTNLAYLFYMGPYCSTFSSASEGIFWEGKNLELNSGVFLHGGAVP